MKEREKQILVSGAFTIPAEAGLEEPLLQQLAGKWGADAIWESCGPFLSAKMQKRNCQIYSATCPVREDQEWIQHHRDKLPQKFLMSEQVTATSDALIIDPMANYFHAKYEIDTRHAPEAWWQVFDRTTGRELPACDWEFDAEKSVVHIHNAERFHAYTVNFLVYQIWDTTSMYDHMVNNLPHPPIVSTDPYTPEARQYIMKHFDQWLADHPYTDVVRLTTLAYHFVLDSDKIGKDKFRDWTGYLDTISIAALKDFEKEYGYRLTSEDFVDQGYYNATHRIPSARYRDWMAFIQKFVFAFSKEIIQKIHQSGKRAAIFQGDHWIGVEPYSERYPELGIDINVGACEDGVALRRLADSSPRDEIKEIRLYPYLFPDVFRTGGDPLSETLNNWIKIRRAMLRKPIDRIGYGGYLRLASRFPEFVDYVTEQAREFRDIKANTGRTLPYTAPIKVAVLNAWGTLRSWINNFVKDQKFFLKRPDVIAVAGSNLLECLSGLPVEVVFLSFEDIRQNGIPEDIDVIINEGEANSAWSGGYYWKDPEIVAPIRKWIHEGGGFIGNIAPTAFDHQGRFFQLADVMGVDLETGKTVMTASMPFPPSEPHFITYNQTGRFDSGIQHSYVFVCHSGAQVLQSSTDGLHVQLASNTFGNGRAVFMAGLPYHGANSRLLHRSIFWAAQKEAQLKKWFSSNVYTDCAAYPETQKWVVVNNTLKLQNTTVHLGKAGQIVNLTLQPFEIHWFDM